MTEAMQARAKIGKRGAGVHPRKLRLARLSGCERIGGDGVNCVQIPRRAKPLSKIPPSPRLDRSERVRRRNSSFPVDWDGPFSRMLRRLREHHVGPAFARMIALAS